jgi:hypothetical protein
MACGQEAPSERPGVASFAIEGAVDAPPSSSSELRAAIVWNSYTETIIGTAAGVAAGDGSFVLEVAGPPPEGAFESTLTHMAAEFDHDQPRIACGAFVAVATDTDLTNIEMIAGVDPFRFVVYTEGNLEPGMLAYELFGPLTAGYHYFQTIASQCENENTCDEQPTVWIGPESDEACVDSPDEVDSCDVGEGASGIGKFPLLIPLGFEGDLTLSIGPIGPGRYVYTL